MHTEIRHMPKTATLVATAFMGLMLMTQNAAADSLSIKWTDNTVVWPGWGTPEKNQSEYIGEPNITGGNVIVGSGGYLEAITFNFQVPDPGWQFPLLKAGDLFLDTNKDGKWDYVLSQYNGRSNSDELYKYLPVTSQPVLYGVHGLTNDNYLTTGPDNQGYWSGYLIRNNEPFAVTNLNSSNSTLLGQGSLTGGYFNNDPLTFFLPLNQVALGSNLTFGFTVNCANDVVLETVNVPTVEPAGLVLLGTGLIVLSIIIRKRAAKRPQVRAPARISP